MARVVRARARVVVRPVRPAAPRHVAIRPTLPKRPAVQKPAPKRTFAIVQKAAAVAKAHPKVVAKKKTVLRVVKKPAPKPVAHGRAGAASAAVGSKGKAPVHGQTGAASFAAGAQSSPMPAQDDDDTSPESELEPVGPDDERESSEDSGSDSGDDDGGDGGDDGGEEAEDGDSGGEESESDGDAEEGEGEDVGALVDLSNLDPGRAVVLGWVLFGVTLSGAMAVGWALGRSKHAR